MGAVDLPIQLPVMLTQIPRADLALLLSVGLIPENELSNKLGVKMAPVTSGPAVNESLETSIPGVFAVGDVRTKALRQIITAAADGAVAVHYAEEYLAANH